MDLNHGSLLLEATALPTEPQPVPHWFAIPKSSYVGIICTRATLLLNVASKYDQRFGASSLASSSKLNLRFQPLTACQVFCLSVWSSTYPPTHPPTHLPTYLTTYPPTYLPTYLIMCLFTLLIGSYIISRLFTINNNLLLVNKEHRQFLWHIWQNRYFRLQRTHVRIQHITFIYY